MAPKAFKNSIEGFTFYFFSNENSEPMHVHVRKGDGMAKFWPDRALHKKVTTAG